MTSRGSKWQQPALGLQLTDTGWEQTDMFTADNPPSVYISRWTRDGATVWQVNEKGMPICRELDNDRDAYLIYQRRYERNLRRNNYTGESKSDIPETPAIWDGDAGKFF